MFAINLLTNHMLRIYL